MIKEGFKMVLATVFFAFCVTQLTQCTDAQRLEKALKTYVEKANKTYPTQLDAVTQLDSCTYILPNILQYRYTVSVHSEDVDTVQVKAMLKENLVRQTKIEVGSAYLRTQGVVFQYYFSDANRQYLFKLDVGPKDYDN